MTTVDVCFRYGNPPDEAVMSAINNAREIYGIRRVVLDGEDRTVTVEYDASRIKDETVAALLRRAGLDLRDKVTLV